MYGQAHLPGAPEGMRNPAPGKPAYPSIPGYNSTLNNSNSQGSKRHNPPTHTHRANNSRSTLSPKSLRGWEFSKGEGQEKCYPALPPHRTSGSYC